MTPAPSTQNNTPCPGITSVSSKVPVSVDLAFTIDRTGSSKDFQVGIPRTVEGIATAVTAKATGAKLWVQSHGDLDCGQEPVLLVEGGTTAEAVSAVQSITYDGGGDAEEHHLDAIQTALVGVPWTANPATNRGALVALVTADSKPLRNGKTPEDLGDEIKARGILLYVVGQEAPVLRRLVVAAGGEYHEISNTPEAVDLQKIAMKVAASITSRSPQKTLTLSLPR